jgi:hypothetical protein
MAWCPNAAALCSCAWPAPAATCRCRLRLEPGLEAAYWRDPASMGGHANELSGCVVGTCIQVRHRGKNLCWRLSGATPLL